MLVSAATGTAGEGEGIDMFFDNVGGRRLTLALSVRKNHGGVVLCGPKQLRPPDGSSGSRKGRPRSDPVRDAWADATAAASD